MREAGDRPVAELRAAHAGRRGRRHGSGPAHRQGARSSGPTKRDRMIELAGQRRDLAAMPLGEVSKLASSVAAEIGYSPGTARRELVRHVRGMQAAAGSTGESDGGECDDRQADRRTGQPGRTGGGADRGRGRGAVVVRWLARLDWLGLALVAAAVAGVLFAGWAVRPKRRLPRHRVRYMRLRVRLRLYPGPGHATLFELWLRWGRGAAARRAKRARPSLGWRARRFRPSQTSVLVGRAQYGRGLRVPVEEHVIFIAPPRKGKSGALAEIIERYPGPVVITTTRGDLHTLTAQSRDSRGPVYVWNPQRLADVASTMRWDLLAGCEDPATAIRRAVPLSSVATYKGEGEDFWAAAIELWLQTLLHVAALRRGSMDLVHYWALARTPESFLAALPGAGGETERWAGLIRDQMTSTATKTTDTIRYMVAANLAFMLDPVLREAITPGPGMFSPGVRPRRRDAVPDRRIPRRAALPGRRAVRRPGHRDLPRGRAGRGAAAGRAAGPADAVGPG